MATQLDIGYTPTPHRSKKDKKRWCGGKPGREHRYRIATPKNLPSYFTSCRGPRQWEVDLIARRPSMASRYGSWRCMHERVCGTCGRVEFGGVTPEQCPTFRLRRLAGTLPAEGETDLASYT